MKFYLSKKIWSCKRGLYTDKVPMNTVKILQGQIESLVEVVRSLRKETNRLLIPSKFP